jgi:periplasmic protein TonB
MGILLLAFAGLSGHTRWQVVSMLEPQTLVPKKERALAPAASPREADDPRQRRLMVIALAVLLVALGFVLYRNRDFWFPGTQEADSEQPVQRPPIASAPTSNAPAQPAPVEAKTNTPTTKAKHRRSAAAKPEATTPATPTPETPAPPAAVTANRTVLPPLEVEVVAGDTHRTVRPGSNSVHVELQAGAPPQPMTDTGGGATQSAANVTSNAAERVQMSADTTEVVTHPVKPGYPLLARQMKVQGSVVLRALISKEGTIQDLHVVSGPAILASAAQDAVRQWRFKPHFVGSEAVETQADITVNFTISTN